MRAVNIADKTKSGRITVLSYGMSRSGKSRFSGTFPRPLFLADATESGWETLKHMDRSVWFEPERVPIVWAIEAAADMKQAIRDAEPLIRRGEVLTVVIDSLTFYSDLFFNALDSTGRIDQRQLYLKLAQHLKDLRIQVHQLGCNVVWLALEKSPGEDTPVGGPMISGSNAQKFAAGCDYVFYHRSYQGSPTAPVQWEIRTRKYQGYQAGGRDEGRLPDPLGYYSVGEDGNEIFVTDCTYRTMAECLGIVQPGEGADVIIQALAEQQASIAVQQAQAAQAALAAREAAVREAKEAKDKEAAAAAAAAPNGAPGIVSPGTGSKRPAAPQARK